MDILDPPLSDKTQLVSSSDGARDRDEDDIANRNLAGSLCRGDLWFANFMIHEWAAMKMMHEYQSASMLRQESPPELESLALKYVHCLRLSIIGRKAPLRLYSQRMLQLACNSAAPKTRNTLCVAGESSLKSREWDKTRFHKLGMPLQS